VNGAARTASYDAASAVLALEEGMISGVQDNVLCVCVCFFSTNARHR
jgi:hypothetical protein